MASLEWLTVFTAFIAFASLFLSIYQIHNHTAQSRIESLLHIFEINRQRMILGFDSPDLFEILNDAEDADPNREQRFLQLWLNQFAVIHLFHARGLFERELMMSLEHDMRDFLNQANMRRNWERHAAFYPKTFQTYVKSVIKDQDSVS